MGTAKVVLEYLKVFLSAPVVFAGVAILFFLLYREPVKGLLQRIAVIRFPGGTELSTSQSERQEQEANLSGKPLPTSQSVPLDLSALSPQQQADIENFVRSERTNAYLWEYRYLNLFLVYWTQQVLDWLVKSPQPVSVYFYDSFWLPIIPSSEERNAILTALEAHHLINRRNDLIEVTEKGREYIGWRGPISPSSVSAAT